MAAVKKALQDVGDVNPHLRARPVGTGPEGALLLKLFSACCPFGQYHLADVGGVFIDVTEK